MLLYRDDGLAVLNQTPHPTPHKIEKVKKQTCRQNIRYYNPPINFHVILLATLRHVV